MATVNFLYRSTKDLSPLTLRLLYRNKDGDDKTFDIKTKIIISRQDWTLIKNNKKMKDAAQLKLTSNIKEEIFALKKSILDSFLKTNENSIDKLWLKSVLKKHYTKENDALPTRLDKYFEYFLDIKKNQFKKKSIVRYATSFNLLKRLLEEEQLNVNIEDVDPDFCNLYVNYCNEVGYAINTIKKYFSVIITVCNHARDNGLKLNN